MFCFAGEAAAALKNTTKECEYHRNKHQTALETTNRLQNELYDLRDRLVVVMTEKDQLEQEASCQLLLLAAVDYCIIKYFILRRGNKSIILAA